MVVLGLFLSAILENITSLEPFDPQNHYYTFKVQCTSCREIHPNLVKISPGETVNIPNSRGKASLVWKCRYCQKENSAKKASQYTFEISPQESIILSFECRGCEFIEFFPDGEWCCKGVKSGTLFRGINLIEGEWYDYDENSLNEVSITNVKWIIKRK
ncbi:hypothetical protein MERGE_002414 [Pneumocystis wakefieldiae]|uniref:Uncharacterized protein n=1 Tax=Pneumocystis wakefieldiae TaxID=38082 RepID=A0A899G0T9_9ASCO|nr:hypothetical protein MERGE_002414 [Pneumocystis wakefieldiae]